jgi:transcriptional regulator GlxA family with amidase domain
MSEYNIRIKYLENLNSALKYIADNYLEDITTSQLAKIANFSEYYFSSVFKKTTGMTVKEYIHHFRINKAEILLKSTNMTISEVAINTGFNDINYFSRIFREYKQVSPTIYRKNSAT